MDLRQMRVGVKVAIASEHGVDLFDIGIFGHGLTGTVCEVREGGQVACLVRLDRHFPALDEWANCLQVSRYESDVCHAGDFEALPGQGEG